MANKEIVEEKIDGIDIADFFTKENQDNGVWCEPSLDGKIGVEFLVIGAESNEAAQLFADYDKDMGRIKDIKDVSTKNEEIRKALATTAAKITKDFRAKNGKPLLIKGEPLKYSFNACYTIMYNSPSIADELIRFSRKDTNFMAKK